MKPFYYSCYFLLLVFLTANADPALATQAHGGPEGVYVHQFSHVFFILAMALFIYWLRSRDLVLEPGWRYLQYACLFFLLWSLDAFFVHLIDEQLNWIRMERIDPWQVRIEAARTGQWLAWVFYIIKLDHLLCVPGMVFLFLGLRRLTARPENEPETAGKRDSQ